MPLRPNRVHPLWRTDHDNNVGIGAPEIEYGYEPGGEWIDLITVHKGGLFGTDYRMLFPSDGIQGIKRFYLDSLVAFGKRGLACQPAIIGIGLGGCKDTCMVLGKRAACLRVGRLAQFRPAVSPALEREFKELGNSIGMGAMGFVGKSMVIDCQHRGRLLPHRRHADVCPCLLPVVAPRRGAGFCRTDGWNTAPIRTGSPIINAGRRWNAGNPSGPRKIRLSTTPTHEALAELRLGDVVYLDGLIYTAREGVYKRALEEQGQYPDGTCRARARRISIARPPPASTPTAVSTWAP